MHKTLIEPIQGCIQDARLVFWSVDLGMHANSMNFAALDPPRIDGGYDLSVADWLVRHHATAYVRTPASLVALRSNTRSKRQVPFRFLGIGDPVLAQVEQPQYETANRYDLSAALGPLPETRDELMGTAKVLGNPSTVLVGADATEGQLRRTPISQFQYLSFATHALVRQDLADLQEAALVLTPRSLTDSFDDGLLEASEIADLRLNADFVALSACNTANFDLNNFASDVPSLATAFAIAGTPATLATLWYVDSASSRTIVESVFSELGRHDSVAARLEALARAQVSFLTNSAGSGRAHPRFWGPFVVFGDSTRPVAPADTEQMSLVSLETLTKRGGELLDAKRSSNSGLLVTGIGEWESESERFGSATYSIGSDLEVRWSSISHEMGSGPVVLDLGNSIVVTGYQWGEDGDPVTTPVVQSLTQDGKALRRTFLDTPGFRSFPSAAIRMSDNQIVLAMTTESLTDDYAKREIKVLLYRLSNNLEVLSKKTLDVTAGAGSLQVSMAESGGRLYLAIVDEFFHSSTERFTDEMLGHRLCGSSPQTWLFEVDANTLTTIETLSIAGISLKRMFADTSGPVIATGHLSSCDGRYRLTAWRLDGLSPVPIYQEPAIIDSRGQGITRTPDGRIVISGNAKRITDVQRAEEHKASLEGTLNPWTT